MIDKKFIITLLSWILIGIGTVTIVGYIAGKPEISAWTHTVPMASPTAMAFIFTGIIFLLLNK